MSDNTMSNTNTLDQEVEVFNRPVAVFIKPLHGKTPQQLTLPATATVEQLYNAAAIPDALFLRFGTTIVSRTKLQLTLQDLGIGHEATLTQTALLLGGARGDLYSTIIKEALKDTSLLATELQIFVQAKKGTAFDATKYQQDLNRLKNTGINGQRVSTRATEKGLRYSLVSTEDQDPSKGKVLPQFKSVGDGLVSVLQSALQQQKGAFAYVNLHKLITNAGDTQFNHLTPCQKMSLALQFAPPGHFLLAGQINRLEGAYPNWRKDLSTEQKASILKLQSDYNKHHLTVVKSMSRLYPNTLWNKHDTKVFQLDLFADTSPAKRSNSGGKPDFSNNNASYNRDGHCDRRRKKRSSRKATEAQLARTQQQHQLGGGAPKAQGVQALPQQNQLALVPAQPRFTPQQQQQIEWLKAEGRKCEKEMEKARSYLKQYPGGKNADKAKHHGRKNSMRMELLREQILQLAKQKSQ